MPAVDLAGPRLKRQGSPRERDFGLERVPQFDGGTQGFIGVAVPCPTPYLVGFKERALRLEQLTQGYITTQQRAPPLAKVRSFRASSTLQRRFP